VASVDNERAALASLNCASRDDTSISVFAFEYDDQLWKANDNERSFGLSEKVALDGSSSC
jgi:exo-beta-1,3-glucanase (GH17 family)